MNEKISRIEISFPVPVELPPGWENTLDALVRMVCKSYEAEHPGRVMWPSRAGDKVLWDEPNEPAHDTSIYEVVVTEREANDRERERRGLPTRPDREH